MNRRVAVDSDTPTIIGKIFSDRPSCGRQSLMNRRVAVDSDTPTIRPKIFSDRPSMRSAVPDKSTRGNGQRHANNVKQLSFALQRRNTINASYFFLN
jgi:hypothetical protein